MAECLARLTDRAEESHLFKGIGPASDCSVSLIQYADDTLFFCQARRKYMKNLKFLWNLFEWASGIKINKEKSELLYMGSKTGKGDRLAGILQCKIGKLPAKYLGLPLTYKPLKKDDWACVIHNVRRRIDGWQAKLLSRGGRLTLVNSVLANLPPTVALFLYFQSTEMGSKVLRGVYVGTSFGKDGQVTLGEAIWWLGKMCVDAGRKAALVLRTWLP